MAEHTPKPWAYELVPEPDERDLPQNEWSGVYFGPADEHGRLLHTTFEGEFTHSPEDGDPESDARLIAAAPDLLAALEGMMEANPTLRTHGIGAPHSEARNRQVAQIEAEDDARAAIRKARGTEGA